jgi:hypothetical protein
MSDSRSTGKEAAERGNRMHGYWKTFIAGKKLVLFRFTLLKLIGPLRHILVCNNGRLKRLLLSPQGFGGKIDLNGSNVVIDFKSKVGDVSKVKPYFEQIMQLAAYRVGLGMPTARCANVYFNEQGHVNLIEHSPDDLDDAFSCFQFLLQFYKIKNNL